VKPWSTSTPCGPFVAENGSAPGMIGAGALDGAAGSSAEGWEVTRPW
jgi:hypothetical protein